MEPLDPAQFSLAQPLFTEMMAWQAIVTAVLNHHSPGSLYVDNAAAPQAALLLSLDGGFVAGTPDNHTFNAALANNLDAILQTARRLNPAAPQLAMRLPEPAWEPALADILGDWRWPPLVEPMRHYLLHTPPPAAPELPAPLAMMPLHGLQPDAPLPTTLAAAIAIGWGDWATFQQQSFGFVVQHGAESVAWCLANVVTGNRCELSVETLPAYRQRGLATAVTQTTVQFCQQQGFTHVGWHCAADNVASQRVAERAGFVLERPYTRYTFLHDEARHFAQLGQLYFFAGMAEDAAEVLAIALELDDNPPDYVYFLAARAEAKVGNGRDALDLLALAIAAGFNDAALLQSLPEFAPLHRRQSWQRLLNDMGSNK